MIPYLKRSQITVTPSLLPAEGAKKKSTGDPHNGVLSTAEAP